MIVAKKRRGISTFIATLLLMVLAVAAGVVIYAYVMGYLGGFTTPQTMGAVSLDTSVLDTNVGTTSGVTAYIRNIGHTSFKPNAVYVQTGTTNIMVPLLASGVGWQFTYPDASTYPPTTTTTNLSENAVGTLKITLTYSGTTAFQPGVTYTIKLIGVDNTQISFNVKG